MRRGGGGGGHVSMLSSVGHDDTPKETLGSLRISTAETVFQKTREQNKTWGKGGARAKAGKIKEECGLALQWHYVCYSTMLHNGWDGRM